MATKTEARMKETLKEYLGEQQEKMQKELLSNANSVFALGFLVGLIFTYSSLTPLIIGLASGYCIAKKEIPLIDAVVLKITMWISGIGARVHNK